MKKWDDIIRKAIEEWDPVCIICLYSGGYDSMIATHLTHTKDFGLPVFTVSIDTNMSADGWGDYVTETAKELNFLNHDVFDNREGFFEWIESVRLKGCPRTRKGHTYTYIRLKERAIEATLKKYKNMYQRPKINKRFNKVLFISGMRRAESVARRDAPEILRYKDKSNAIFASPILYWSDEDCIKFRYEKDFPINPFYDTVKGSGDCQCNWGNFITMNMLKKYSPKLAAGNAATIDRISRENHGYGWDGALDGQDHLFDVGDIDDGEINPMSLCSNCTRAKAKDNRSMEEVYLQRGLW